MISMPNQLLNETMPDGSRLFFILPENCPPHRLLWFIICLRALPTAYVTDFVTGETWMDFRWRKQKFSIHNPYGQYWFFADNPDCSETLLHELAEYFAMRIPPEKA